MNIPTLAGIIDRRILINYTADPDCVQRILPTPFKPKLFKGKAIVGICLIRLKSIRPKGLPAFLGIGSENGAHRIAVEWDHNGQDRQGVFIPRRDTSSFINATAGGRIFPGKHFLAKFDVKEEADHFHIAFVSSDGTTVSLDAKKANAINPDSIFTNLDTASAFFEGGSMGYSPSRDKFDGLELKTFTWKIRPLRVTAVHSSFFENTNIFPKGSIKFDNALLMTEIKHEWHSLQTLRK